MTVYKSVDIINRFIEHTPKDWGIYIHIDKKSSILPNELSRYNYCIKSNTIYWASWKHLNAFFLLLKEASKIKYDYYHLVTGQDFYAINPLKFDTIIGNTKKNFIEIFKIPNINWWDDGGLSIYRTFGLAYWGDIRNNVFCHYANSLLRKIQLYSPIKRKLPLFPLYGGSVYCSLHYDFVIWMLTNDIAIKFLNNLKYCICPEEIFFQTLIMQSPYRDKIIKNNLRYIDWTIENPPKVLNLEDFKNICQSDALFCRKIIEGNGLIEKLESHLLQI